MPSHFFSGALHVYHLTAVTADIHRQDFSVYPRKWYIDAAFRCRGCSEEFLFSAKEQQFWYEECQFYVDSMPRDCPACRRALRDLKALKQEYDREVASADRRDAAIESKERLIKVIDALLAAGIQESRRMTLVRHTLAEQIKKSRQAGMT